MMYERTYGYRYASMKGASTTQIAAQMRKDIAALTDAGMLPGAPITYSVQSAYFSGGSSIDIEVRGFAGEEWEPQEWTCRGCHRIARTPGGEWPDGSCLCGIRDFDRLGAHRGRTCEAQAIVTALEELHRAYNHDGSDVQTDYFDVRYYGSVRFENAWGAQERAAKGARRKELKGTISGRTLRNEQKRLLVEHLTESARAKDSHGFGWSARNTFDQLLFWHRFAHRRTHAPRPNHTHDGGEA